MIAAHMNNSKIVEKLIPYEGKMQNIYGETALMIAIHNGAIESAKILIPVELMI